jgi:hypothetical protein
LALSFPDAAESRASFSSTHPDFAVPCFPADGSIFPERIPAAARVFLITNLLRDSGL